MRFQIKLLIILAFFRTLSAFDPQDSQVSPQFQLRLNFLKASNKVSVEKRTHCVDSFMLDISEISMKDRLMASNFIKKLLSHDHFIDSSCYGHARLVTKPQVLGPVELRPNSSHSYMLVVTSPVASPESEYLGMVYFSQTCPSAFQSKKLFFNEVYEDDGILTLVNGNLRYEFYSTMSFTDVIPIVTKNIALIKTNTKADSIIIYFAYLDEVEGYLLMLYTLPSGEWHQKYSCVENGYLLKGVRMPVERNPYGRKAPIYEINGESTWLNINPSLKSS